MKRQIKRWMIAIGIAAVLAGLGSRTNASMIDLGERDLATRLMSEPAARAYIEMDQGLPAGTLTYLNAFDSDTSTFFNNGAVDGSHFDVTLTDGGINGLVSWDLGTTGFQLSYVFLKDGRGSNTGPYLYHLYGVSPDEVFKGLNQFVTVNGIRDITYLAFYGEPGSPTVPEGGVTASLLAMSLGTIELLRRFRVRACASA